MIRLGGFALVALLSPLSAAAQAQAHPPAPRVVSAPALPMELGDFELVDTRIYADSLLGTWYTYAAGREHRVNVMVQPSHAFDEDAGPGEIVARAVRSFKGGRGALAPGATREFIHDRPDTLDAGGEALPGYLVALHERAQGAERLVVLHVYPLGSRYVRVMSTLSGGPAELDRAARFVRELVPAVIAAWRP